MKGFALSAKRAPDMTPDSSVSVDVVPGIPSVQNMIAKAEQEDPMKKKPGLDYGSTDLTEMMKIAQPILEAFLMGGTADAGAKPKK